MRADRLLKLADYLETVPRGNFNMRTWSRQGSLVENGFWEPKECGFAGCAIGWAIHGQLFRDLKWKSPARMSPTLRSDPYTSNYAAIGVVFDISVWAAMHDLFGPHLVGTPKQVAKRIRAFVKSNTKAAP